MVSLSRWAWCRSCWPSSRLRPDHTEPPGRAAPGQSPLEPLEALQARSYQLLAQLTVIKSLLLLHRAQLDLSVAGPLVATDLTPWLLRRLALACAMARELRQAATRALA